ncbi:MAG: zinc ribbon domain-containing protein [Deltaproteobacteria bacterium]|nr:MAG: zinc ribbon domain-containing protein [Deltaproteobacteria bacterium]
MPLFDYRCAACEQEFEELTSAAAASGVTCPSCASPQVTRLLSAFAVGRTGAAPESGPCGACGAPRRGMCGEG